MFISVFSLVIHHLAIYNVLIQKVVLVIPKITTGNSYNPFHEIIIIFSTFFKLFSTSSLKVISATKKNFFLSWESYVLFSRYLRFCIFNHLMIYQICDIMMNIIIWDRVHFWLYILNHNSLSNQIWPIDRCKQGQQFWGMGLSSRSFSVQRPAPITQ